MSEFMQIAPNGQWNLVKSEGTGVVNAPKNLGQVNEIGVQPAGPVPRITPQPALHEGVMGHSPAVSRDTAISPAGGTVVRGQGQARVHDYNPQAGSILNPNAPKSVGWAKPSATPFEDAARAEAQGGSFSGKPSAAPAVPPVHAGGLTGLDRIKHVSQQPINAMKSESETHDPKGHCNNCGSKACSGSECKVDHAKAAVDMNDEKNKGFRNQIKVANNGQWNLKSLKKGLYDGDNIIEHPIHGPSEIEHKHMTDGRVFTTAKTLGGKVWHKSEHPNANAARANYDTLISQAKGSS